MLIDSAFRNKQRIGDLVVRLAAADVQQDLRLALRKLFGTILRHRRRSRFEVAYQIEQQLLREKTSSVDHRFDRGYDVLPLLWLMYKLEQEAADAGGAAVLLLGNHEGMVLAGDVRYTRGKYLETARQLGMENYRQLFSPDTELGRWLATRNTMLRIGRNLFVHAGLSARLLERNLEMDTLNARMSEGLYRTSKERREDPTLEFLYRSAGPVWYRGMVCTDEKYDPLTPEQTDALLRRYDADRLLVGHTIFPDISTFHDGRVIAVNVQNELNRRKNRGRAVLIEGSRISVVGNRGVKRVLEE